MTTSTQPRVAKGVPTGGEFSAFGHSDSVPALSAPTVNDDFVAYRLGESGFAAHMSVEEIARVTAELNASRDFRDENITAVADQVHRDTAGHTVSDAIAVDQGIIHLTRLGHEEEAAALRRVLGKDESVPAADIFAVPGTNTRLHVLRSEPVPDGKTVPVPHDDPRLQAGEVFDVVLAEDTVFFHSSVAGYPQDTQAIRFQANRPLTDEEAYALSGVVGYANSSAIGGEPLDNPKYGPSRDTPFSFISHIDTNKGRQGNFEKFQEMIPDLIANGSKPRSTQGGSRAIEPFGDPDLKLEIYYAE